MRSLLQSFVNSVREDFGYPARLVALLEAHPKIRVDLDDRRPDISEQSVTRWHELGKQAGEAHGYLRGWRTAGRYYFESFSVMRPEYAQLGRCDVVNDWTCDISELHGFSASKSELRDFESTDQLVETNSREMISEISLQKLNENLAHREIRIIHSPDIDYFTRYRWDGRLWLMNSGGSHHTAAAKYIAARLRHRVPLTGKIYTYSLHAPAIASLCNDYRIFVINDDGEIHSAFLKAMRSFRATWLWHSMPQQYGEAKAILLPRNERRSMRVADALDAAGIADLGKHLQKLASRQQ